MAEYDLAELYKTYEGFDDPRLSVELGGRDPLEDKKFRPTVFDVSVEVTSELKASIASFSIGNVFNETAGLYDMSNLKKYIYLGLDVKIYMGHAARIVEVFRGYVARVDFEYDPDDLSEGLVHVTAMDVKGIMMANNSSKRLKANYYSDAVKEIFDGSAYQDLINRQVIADLTVIDTPDKPGGGDATGGAMGGLGGGAVGGLGGAGAGEQPDIRIEMVAESDYEFVVKVAKKFNYEFFTIGGHVTFRKAKANTMDLIEIYPSQVIEAFDIGYDITGVVGQVIVRTIDIAKGTRIEVKKKNSGKFSLGGKAKPLISNQQYVYTDSSVETQEQATQRAEYLMEEMSYRLGNLNMRLRGMPELVPGRFVKLRDFGDGISNTFYITDVIHEYNRSGRYSTTIIGRASTMSQ